MPTFTPKQVSEILEIPPSTLRRYRSQWSDYLSAPGNDRLYTSVDIDTLRIIRDHLNKRKSRDEIIAALQDQPETLLLGEGEYTDQPEDVFPEDTPPTSALQIYDQFFKPALIAKDETIKAKDEHIADLKKEVTWLRLPWYKKLFRDPPE